MMAIRKLLLVALKDFRLIFRDRSALVLMLLAPFLLTIGMGAVTGRFSGTSSNRLASKMAAVFLSIASPQLLNNSLGNHITHAAIRPLAHDGRLFDQHALPGCAAHDGEKLGRHLDLLARNSVQIQ